jgi:hypothetical protein
VRFAVAMRLAASGSILIGGCADSYTPPAQQGPAITWESERVQPSAAATDAQTAAASAAPECRDYTQTVRIDGQEQQATGRACMQPDGSWRLTPPAAPPGSPAPVYAYPVYRAYPAYYPYPYYYPYYPYYPSAFFGSAFFFGSSKHKHHHHHHRHHHHGGHKHGGRSR